MSCPFRLRPVTNWAPQSELIKEKDKKSNKDKEPVQDSDRKKEAYETLMASKNIMESIKNQTRIKLIELRLTEAEKQELDQIMAEELRIAEGQIKSEELDTILRDCQSIEPMLQKIEGLIDQVMKGHPQKNKPKPSRKPKIHTSERVDGDNFLGHAFHKLEEWLEPGPGWESSESDSDEKGNERRHHYQRNELQYDLKESEPPGSMDKGTQRGGSYGAIKPTPLDKYDAWPIAAKGGSQKKI
ncbi:hypothetical protein C0995_002653, partial [Termitomyces sp. Mi166